MLQKNRRFKVFLNMLIEACMIFVSYHIAVLIRFSIMNGKLNPVQESFSTELLILFVSLFTVVLFYLFHLYIPVHQRKLAAELTKVVLIGFLSVLALGSTLFILRVEDYSRLTLLFSFLIYSLALCIKRICWHSIARKRFEMGIDVHRVILIGSGKPAEDYWNDIRECPQYGLKVIGYIGNDTNAGLGQHFGDLSRIEDVLENIPCDEVVVALEPQESNHMQTVLDVVSKEGLRVSMVPFFKEYYPRHPTIDSFRQSVVIDLRATPLDSIPLAALKRFFDVFVSLVLLILLSPLMLVTAVIIKLESPGPVFFQQTRVGLNKKEFTMLKFRSMRVNAEENTAWTKGGDPRRTRFGSFIRKYSIDELPQLINTLKGDMSLVGPRPEIPFYTHQFKESVPLYLVRQQVRPGMTGWAQVHGLRGDTSIDARVKYDIWYIENWTPWLDLRILFLTLLGGFINHEETLNESGSENETCNATKSEGQIEN